MPKQEYKELCSCCGRKYDGLKEGKMRMGLPYCSIHCADIHWPKFKEERERLQLVREEACN